MEFLQFIIAMLCLFITASYINYLTWFKEQYYRTRKFEIECFLKPEFIRDLTKLLEIQADSKQEAEGFVKDCMQQTINNIKGK